MSASYLNYEKVKKIFFIHLTYIDPNTLTQKYYTFSNDFVNVYENLSSGNTVNAEERLIDLPSFIREIDLIKNNVIVKSSYSISLINKDRQLNDFFSTNIFTNQIIKICVTTEEDAKIENGIFNYTVLATAIIKDIDISDTVKISLKEINYYEQTMNSTNISVFNYTNQKSDLAKKNKYCIFGNHKNYKVENINYAADDFFNTTGIGVNLTGGYNDSEIGYTWVMEIVNASDAVKVRELLGNDSYVKFAGFNSVYDVYNKKGFKVIKQHPTNNLAFLLESAYYDVTLTNVGLMVNTKKSLFTNNKFLVSKNNNGQSASLYATNTLASVHGFYSSSDNYLTLTNSWDFLKPGHIIEVRRTTGLTGNGNAYVEDFLVKSYDKSTKKVYLGSKINKLSDGTIEITGTDFLSHNITNSNKTDYTVYFNYLQSININDIELYNRRQYFDIYLDNASNFTLNQYTNPRYFLSFITVTDTNISGNNPYHLNKNALYFENDATITSPYTPLLTSTSNSRGGLTYKIKYRTGFTTYAQIKTVLDLIFTTSSFTGSGVTGTLTPTTETYLSSGICNNAYFGIYVQSAEYHSSLGDEQNFYNNSEPVIFYFDTTTANDYNIDTELYLLKDSMSSSKFKRVLINATDPAANIASALCTVANEKSSTTSPYLLPICAYYCTTENRVRIKLLNFNNTSNKGIIKGCGSTVLASNDINKRNFYSKIESLEHILYLDVLASTISLTSPYAQQLDYRTLYAPITDLEQRRFTIEYMDKDELENSDIIVDEDNFFKYTPISSYGQGNIMLGIFNIASYVSSSIKNDRPYTYYSSTLPNRNNYLRSFNRQLNHGFSQYKIPDISSVYVNYCRDNLHVSDLITAIFNFFGVSSSAYSTTDLSTLKTNHPYLYAGLEIKDSKMLYQFLNTLLLSFNIVSYTDKNGVIRFKFFDIYDTTSPKEIDYYSLKDYNYLISDYLNSIAYIKTNLNNKNNEYESITTVNDTFLDSITSLTNFSNELTLETNIADADLLNLTYSSKTYKDLLTKKYFKKFITLEVYLSATDFSIDLFDNVKIIDHPEFSSSVIFKVFKVENNFNTVKLTLYRLN